MIELTRCYRFPAAHVLCHDSFDDDENFRVFGKCANPGGHGHNYGIEVTVTGPVDAESGEIMSRERLDSIVGDRILQRFSHRLLNDDALFEERVPTAENIANAIYHEIEAPIDAAGTARLCRVCVLETRKNRFDYSDVDASRGSNPAVSSPRAR